MCLHYLQFVIKTLIFIDYVDYFNKLATSVCLIVTLLRSSWIFSTLGFFLHSSHIHNSKQEVQCTCTQSGDLALWAFDSTLSYFICSGGFYSSLISKYWNQILIKTRVSVFRSSQDFSVLPEKLFVPVLVKSYCNRNKSHIHFTTIKNVIRHWVYRTLIYEFRTQRVYAPSLVIFFLNTVAFSVTLFTVQGQL